MTRLALWFCAAVMLLVALYWSLTRPLYLGLSDLPEHDSDPVNGRRVFLAGGCTSCHGELLEGGIELKSDFGTFVTPNISPDPGTGIGNWSELDLVNAMMLGSSPGGNHYYPAFPYTSYTRMKVQDVMDLWAYMNTLEPVANSVNSHELDFPWNLRSGIGLWKILYLRQGPVATEGAQSVLFEQGRYLVEGPGHCGECHTPRDVFGGPDDSQWLAGGPAPDGEGGVPNITPHPEGLGSWSKADIVYFLESGFMPDFDTVGGSMVSVQEHFAQLPESDREAVATYLKAIPARP